MVAFELRIKSALLFYGLFFIFVIVSGVAYGAIEKQLRVLAQAKTVEDKQAPHTWLG